MYFDGDSLYFLKNIEESCHLERKMPEQMPFKFPWYLIYFSRYEGNLKWSVLRMYIRTVFPHNTRCFQNQRIMSPWKQEPKQMPFKVLRYIILFSRYVGKSKRVSQCGGYFGCSRQTWNCFKKNLKSVS